MIAWIAEIPCTLLIPFLSPPSLHSSASTHLSSYLTTIETFLANIQSEFFEETEFLEVEVGTTNADQMRVGRENGGGVAKRTEDSFFAIRLEGGEGERGEGREGREGERGERGEGRG